MALRRRRCCFIQIDDRRVPDLAALFRGTLTLHLQDSIEFLCAISGERFALTPTDLQLLAALSGCEWREEQLADRHGVDASRLQQLLAVGVVLSDRPDCAASLHWLEQEAAFERIGWFDLAAVYQAQTRWFGVEGPDADREHTANAHRQRLEAHVARRGAAPTHFSARPDRTAQRSLPIPELTGDFAQLLARRTTVRHFDMSRELPLADLNWVLYATFGALGTLELAPGVTAIKRSSPSGGGLHPTDAYLLVLAVAELQPGLYHYNVEHHRLDLLRHIAVEEGRRLLTTFTAGQGYFSEVHAAFVQVLRFDRHFWKYGDHKKAYKAVLQDAAHLSQTFYLCAAERSLGAYYTAAINDADIGAALGLDPVREAAVGINGLGLIDTSRNALHFVPQPYRP
jgi:putative peptide maturation dehydrogenase